MSIETEVQKLSAWQRAVLDSADYCIISTDTRGVIATFNRSAEDMLGYTAKEMIGRETPEIIHNPEEVQEYAEILSEEFGKPVEPGFEVFVAKARSGIVDEREWHYIHKNGSTIPVFLSVTALRSSGQEIIGFLGIAYDLRERKAMLANLQDTETRYSTLFNDSGDAICLIDSEARFVECNPAALTMFACSRDDIVGSTVQKFSPDKQSDGTRSSETFFNKIEAAFTGKYQFFDWKHIRFDGAPFDAEISLSAVKINNIAYIQAIVRDVTERKRFEEQLSFQARHDSLTGLLNRTALHETFPTHVDNAKTTGGYVVMVLLDLNRFKEINDTLGHHIGDLILAQMGPRLQNFDIDPTATIVRLGGDEFAFLTSTTRSIGEIKAAAEELLETVRIPFEVSGFNVSIGASAGIACYPEHGEDSHQLLRAADVAMYEAKNHSLGIKVYDPVIDEYSTQRLKFGSDLSNAVSDHQLVLHYQPKVNIRTGDISGFEALVRWQHPEDGLLDPDSFIDLVEMGEAIHPFTRTVMALAADDKKRLQAIGFRQPIAINLSTRNLIDDKCFKTLEAALAGNNLSTTEIQLELTESAFMQDPESAIALLNKFSRIGVKIAIDDFGTGYSSLSYLRRLPVDALKIDRSFVINMLSNTQDASIVRSTIALAHGLDLKVIAEGVENEATFELLRKMDCDEAQGYGICRPLPLDDMVAWLTEHQKGVV